MAAPSEDLVAIASGAKVKVAGWSKLLRAKHIEFVIATPCPEALGDEPDHVELWVAEEDAEHAKSILRASADDDEPPLW
jgi:hypothetical protein